MRDRREFLPERIGQDGASVVDEIPGIASQADIPMLLDAWGRERQHRVEYLLALRRVRRLLRRIDAEGGLAPRRARQVRQLIRVMKDLEEADRLDGS